jgi:hypothetical protein
MIGGRSGGSWQSGSSGSQRHRSLRCGMGQQEPWYSWPHRRERACVPRRPRARTWPVEAMDVPAADSGVCDGIRRVRAEQTDRLLRAPGAPDLNTRATRARALHSGSSGRGEAPSRLGGGSSPAPRGPRWPPQGWSVSWDMTPRRRRPGTSCLSASDSLLRLPSRSIRPPGLSISLPGRCTRRLRPPGQRRSGVEAGSVERTSHSVVPPCDCDRYPRRARLEGKNP